MVVGVAVHRWSMELTQRAFCPHFHTQPVGDVDTVIHRHHIRSMRKAFYSFHLGMPIKSMMCEVRTYKTDLTANDKLRLTLDGVQTLNIFQTMHGARSLIAKDGIRADWRAIGGDLRKAMMTEREAGERKVA